MLLAILLLICQSGPSPDVQEVASRISVTPESLSAAGTQATAVGPVVSALSSALKTQGPILEASDIKIASGRALCRELEARIQQGSGSANDVADLSLARASLQADLAARQSTLDQLFLSAVSGLPAAQAATLSSIRSNEQWDLPAYFLVTSRPAADWVLLRDAHAAEQTAKKKGESVDPVVQNIVSAALSDSAVSSAKASHDAGLASVTTAWVAAIQ